MANDIASPDAILVRSQAMHDIAIPTSVLCIGRAGAGTNNNTPVRDDERQGSRRLQRPWRQRQCGQGTGYRWHADAGTRNLFPALRFVSGLVGDDESLHKQVEVGKKHFVGHELRGSTLGIVGLGAIGSLLAESAIQLGMNVVGYDPKSPSMPPGACLRRC